MKHIVSLKRIISEKLFSHVYERWRLFARQDADASWIRRCLHRPSKSGRIQSIVWHIV